MATRSQSRDTNHNGPRKRPSRRLQPKPEEQVDDSAWIHRDKLAAIEIQEMEDAGMHVRQPYRSDSVGQAGRTTRSSSRSMSRNGVRKTQSKDMLGDEDLTNGQDDYEKKRVSTIQAAEEEEFYDQEYDSHYQADPREDEQYHKGHATRPSTSRIPISKAAAASSEALDGASRSRSGSNVPSTWEDLKRMRSGSAGSGILLDEAEQMHSSTEREPLRKTSTTTPRKPTARSTSTQRPNSSSGTKRPSTSHRPEGEAPWIATMYKPDPRLPPDQQMLPTHAKRMMQEQWEKEGKTGSTYDRDFNLLDNEEIQPPEKPTVVVQPAAAEDKENAPPPPPLKNDVPEEWPLIQERANGTASPRPGTANGGYRITPTITAHSPVLPQPSPKPVELAAEEKPPIRMPDYNEKDERDLKKGCCCVMM